MKFTDVLTITLSLVCAVYLFYNGNIIGGVGWMLLALYSLINTILVIVIKGYRDIIEDMAKILKLKEKKHVPFP
jgi:hypothetical protein